MKLLRNGIGIMISLCVASATHTMNHAVPQLFQRVKCVPQDFYNFVGQHLENRKQARIAALERNLHSKGDAEVHRVYKTISQEIVKADKELSRKRCKNINTLDMLAGNDALKQAYDNITTKEDKIKIIAPILGAAPTAETAFLKSAQKNYKQELDKIVATKTAEIQTQKQKWVDQDKQSRPSSRLWRQVWQRSVLWPTRHTQLHDIHKKYDEIISEHTAQKMSVVTEGLQALEETKQLRLRVAQLEKERKELQKQRRLALLIGKRPTGSITNPKFTNLRTVSPAQQ